MMKIALGLEGSFPGNHVDLSNESCLILLDMSVAQFALVDDMWQCERGVPASGTKALFESYVWNA